MCNLLFLFIRIVTYVREVVNCVYVIRIVYILSLPLYLCVHNIIVCEFIHVTCVHVFLLVIALFNMCWYPGDDVNRITIIISIPYSHTHALLSGNPAPVEDQNSAKILLLFCRDNKQVLQMESMDDGVTWGSMVDITEMVVSTAWSFVGTGPPGGIQLPSGRLVIGVCALNKFMCVYSHVVYYVGICTMA